VKDLSAWYAAALRAFPKHYRIARGEEMLGTLLEGAQPGRTRPALREMAGIAGTGLLFRLTIRRGRGTLTAAVAAALAGGVLTATLFSWAAWSLAAPPLPAQATADAIALGVVGQEPIEVQRFDFVFGDNGYDEGSPGWIEYRYESISPSSRALPAPPAGMRLSLSDNTFTITRTTPPAVPWMTVLGLLAGAVGGWLLAGRTSRLVADRGPVVLAATMVNTSLTFVMLLPMWLASAASLAAGGDFGPPWIALYWSPYREITVLGVAPAVVTLALVEFGRPVDRTVDRNRAGLEGRPG
jgi:hypothetical protein